jgi:hypothetical protein
MNLKFLIVVVLHGISQKREEELLMLKNGLKRRKNPGNARNSKYQNESQRKI